MLLSVILSFKNELAVFPDLFARLDAVMAELGDDYEYVFINDASTDGSLGFLMERARRDRHVKIINTTRCFGLEECYFAGLRYAKGDAIVIVPPDCQDPPEMIPELWREFKKGVDVVYTTRLSRPGESTFKMFLTGLAYRALFRMTKVIVPDSGDFRIISRKVVDHMLKVEERTPFIRGLTFWLGYKHKQVFYHRERRKAGDCHYPILGGAPPKAFVNAIITYSRWPMWTMMKTGILFIVASLLSGLGFLAAILSGAAVPGWLVLCAVLFFLSGVHIIFLGFVGLYAAAAHDEARGRPNYLVESTYGFDKN